MSESSDDAVLSAEDGVPPLVDASSEDDVEVVAQAPEVVPTPAPRHDSVAPMSRKLAPPPKPKRDSSSPGSMPPSAGETPSLGSLKAPSAPAISYQDAPASARDDVAAALAGTDSLRAIGEALAKDAGAFSANETPTGGRPPVPRPRSQPNITAPQDSALAGQDALSASVQSSLPSESSRPSEKAIPAPEASPASASVPPTKSGGVFAQRIISVGTPSSPPVAPAPAASVAPPPAAPSPVPPPSPLEMPAVSVASRPLEVPPPPLAPSIAEVPPVVVASSPVEAPPAPIPPPVFGSATAPEPIVEVETSGGLLVPPPIAEVSSALAPAAAPVWERSVEVASDEAPPDIPITVDEDEPTSPHASSAPLEVPPPPPLPSAPLIPAEPTPPPPGFQAISAPPAGTDAAEERGPDSADRLQVEELSREDSPSIPPDEPTPMMPPPAPSARAEAKQPPPPPKRAPAPPPREEIISPEVDKPEVDKAEVDKKKVKQKRAWWEELFSEDFVRANWKVSDEQIKREVTFVEESLGVAPGGVVLDLGCGSGQHAVELASRGYGVVGYDLSLYQLALAADIAQERSQKINFLQGDMREMAFEEMFDGIFCWNTTFGYFEEDKNYSVAERAFRALRPGGMFLVDVINRDFVAAHTPSSMWFEGDACVCMDDAVIDYFTSRLRVKRSVILDDGRTRECTYSVRLYSFHELGKLLHEVGFRVTEVSGHPATPGVFLGQASPRILMLAQRP